MYSSPTATSRWSRTPSTRPPGGRSPPGRGARTPRPSPTDAPRADLGSRRPPDRRLSPPQGDQRDPGRRPLRRRGGEAGLSPPGEPVPDRLGAGHRPIRGVSLVEDPRGRPDVRDPPRPDRGAGRLSFPSGGPG